MRYSRGSNSAETDRTAHDDKLAVFGMIDVEQRSPLAQMRIDEHLAQRANRTAGGAVFVQQLEQLVPAAFAGFGADFCIELVHPRDTIAKRIILRVFGPVRAVERFAERNPVPFVVANDGDETVGSRIDVVWRERHAAVPVAGADNVLAFAYGKRQVRGHCRVDCIKHSDFGAERDARALARKQRCDNGPVKVRAGGEVYERWPCFEGRPVRKARRNP